MRDGSKKKYPFSKREKFPILKVFLKTLPKNNEILLARNNLIPTKDLGGPILE